MTESNLEMLELRAREQRKQLHNSVQELKSSVQEKLDPILQANPAVDKYFTIAGSGRRPPARRARGRAGGRWPARNCSC